MSANKVGFSGHQDTSFRWRVSDGLGIDAVVEADTMKLRQSARVLKGKAVASVRASVIAFNGLDDDGRVTNVLLRMQHAFEMLMKAALNQGGVSVFDKKTGKSIGLEKAINLAQGDRRIRLGLDEAGLIRTIDARDCCTDR